ncbi:uncharacterized protein [Apostichopus japonicus]|uniref:uncharacterized protein n=1 Tax=Stichopus japonicus TaxID=307972 RepID=UPI003AB556A5
MLTLIKGIGNAKYISLIVGTEKEKQPNMIRREIYEVFLAGVLLSMVSWSSASDFCMSGQFDAITRTSDGNTYAFKDDLVVQLIDAGTDVASGYPKAICEVFPGIPSNLDAAIYWTNGKTYFFKGSQYWRTTGTTPDDGYPKQISDYFPGLPNDIDAAVVWGGNSKGFFFKGTEYWRFNPITDSTERGNIDTNTYWPGYNQGTVDAAFQWSNGRTYLFKGEQYWRYNDAAHRVDSGFPLSTSKEWLGCPTNEPAMPLVDVCVPDSCTCSSLSELDGCISGQFDAITRTSDGKTYAFKDNLVMKLNEPGTAVACGYPKEITDVFPLLPSYLDAAVNWNNGKTYFFKGSQYWATTGTTLDSGYPKQISAHWPGLPNDIDAAVVWGGNGKGFFFKGTQYWRYNPISDSTERGNIDTNTYWPGYNQGTVDAAFQWSNGRTYLFKGEQYWRYNDAAHRIDSGFPLSTSKEWLGCPTIRTTIPSEEMCPSGLGCVSGSFDAITRTSDGNTYAFKGTLVAKLADGDTIIAAGYPKPICDVFIGIPSNLDAAVFWGNGKTYFFKGDQYWRTSGTSPDSGYPKQISAAWHGLPNDIDAAVVWEPNGKGYFFKGTKYWRYNPDSDSTEGGNIDTNTNWHGYNQGTVDAAIQWSNGRTYLFKDELYWRYDDDNNRVESGYPLWTTKEWLGCPTNGPTIPMKNKCLPSTCQ